MEIKLREIIGPDLVVHVKLTDLIDEMKGKESWVDQMLAIHTCARIIEGIGVTPLEELITPQSSPGEAAKLMSHLTPLLDWCKRHGVTHQPAERA